MARKSRKQNTDGSPVKIVAPTIPTAGYVRLSVEDVKKKGDSIENQKEIILDFLSNHPRLHLHDMYVDDGISGVTFERPAFTKMLEDIEQGKIGCIVVKDISRFGRNAIDAGYYVTRHFPSRGVRFISVNDKVDSTDGDVNLEFMLKNMLNEVYAIDTG